MRISRALVAALALPLGCDGTAETSVVPPPMVIEHAEPPGPPDHATEANGPGAVFAVEHFFFGDVDPDGHHNALAWKKIGFDLDHSISTSKTLSCKPVDGAYSANIIDGDAGIDNEFGDVMMPLFDTVDFDISNQNDKAIASGTATLLIELPVLGREFDQTGVGANVLETGSLGHAAAIDTSDKWPIAKESLDPDDPTRALDHFSDGYITAGTWVSASSADVHLTLLL